MCGAWPLDRLTIITGAVMAITGGDIETTRLLQATGHAT
jgi:hypothetical protein